MGTTAEKFNYAFGTKNLLKTEINKINNVLDDNSTFRSYPQELFNGYLDILNNGTDTLWNNLEKVSQTGTEAVLEGVETAPMKMVLNGNTSQDADPTPDDPKDIKVVTDNNVISVQGKNLLDTSMYSLGSINGNTGQNEESSSVYRFDKYNEVKPNTTIYLLKHLCIYFYNENKGFISSNITGNLTITTPPNTKYIRFRIFGADFSAFNPNDYMVSYTQETDFVPYSKTDYPINLGDIEQCKINTPKDFPFKAINGNEYYDTLTDEQKNALNYGSWYVHKAIGKKVVTSSEILGQTDSYSNVIYYKFNKNTDSINYNNNNSMVAFYTHAKISNSFNFDSLSQVSTINSLAENTRYWVGFPKGTTLAQAKEKLVGSVLYYILKTPTEEEITNTTLIEQLEAIYKAKSVKDKTYITQTNDDLPFVLDVEAIKEYSVE